MPLLDALIYGVRDILVALNPLVRKSRVNLGTGLSAVVDEENDCITITSTGGGGGSAPGGVAGQVQYQVDASTFGGASKVWRNSSGFLTIGSSIASAAQTGALRFDIESLVKSRNYDDDQDLTIFHVTYDSGTNALVIGATYSSGAPDPATSFGAVQVFGVSLFEFGTADQVNGITAQTAGGGQIGIYSGASMTLEAPGIELFGEVSTYGGGDGVLRFNKATTLATVNPVDACFLQYDGAVDYLKYLRPDGSWITLDGGSGGGSPGGSDKQFQFDDAGMFGGSSGLVYDTINNRAQFVGAYNFVTGANKAIVQCTPTANRTITIQDATTTLVGRDTTDTLTSKTMVLGSNTLTDTSAALGDLVKHNGTRFVRFARGTANQIPSVNSGGTDLAYALLVNANVSSSAAIAASKLAPPGSNTQVLYNAIGTFAGHSGFVYDSAGKVTLTAGVESGSAPYATLGSFRSGTTTTIVAARNADNTGNIAALVTDSSDNLYVGANGSFTSAAINTKVIGSTSVSLGVGSADYLTVAGSEVKASKPIVGDKVASPWGVHGRVDVATADANHTLTAAEYAYSLVRITGAQTAPRTMTFPAPSSHIQGYWKIVSTVCTGGNSQIILTTGSGSTATLGSAGAQQVGLYWFDTDGVHLVTALGTSW